MAVFLQLNNRMCVVSSSLCIVVSPMPMALVSALCLDEFGFVELFGGQEFSISWGG